MSLSEAFIRRSGLSSTTPKRGHSSPDWCRFARKAAYDVSRACDTRLGRDSAVKVLPELFDLGPHPLARFEHDAHVLASLKHPTIATVYGLAETDVSAR